MGGPLTTLHRTIVRGPVLRQGSEHGYHRLVAREGEPHVVREDLIGHAWQVPAHNGRRTLLHLAHMTDLQLADVQSPVRFEFLNRYLGDPRVSTVVPVQRPQEALVPHAVEAMIRTLNAVDGSPLTGAPLTLVATTGDAIDNAQWNETLAFLALLDGGTVRTDSGGPSYQGVQSSEWPDTAFWKPEGEGPQGPDQWRELFGFPHRPGLLRAALDDFQARGLRLPWLACVGNHETLTQGVGALTRPLLEFLAGGRKPVDGPTRPGLDEVPALFAHRPDAYLSGRQAPVTPDAARRGITRAEFVAAHFRPGSRPAGHGFTAENLSEGSAHYVYDDRDSGIRFITLDTSCLQGGVDGHVSAEQRRWLEARLTEVHSRHRLADGGESTTGNEDRLVVVLSHHGSDTLLDGRSPSPDPSGPPALSEAEELIRVLHRFPNVVLWLNGHTHRNTARPWRSPAGDGRGFWEVTTCAVMDWPCQTRLVELLDNGDGTLSVRCTMLDHDAPLQPGPDNGLDSLASLHRELAANVPWRGVERLPGGPGDRNADLLLRDPAAFTRRR
ncbi:TIGR03767 family metallophosphoesterase [Kitasatospora sp. NPDC048540]|uniref:TIGR03767 family metallophosphoesterase n=1 Tax=Kitasatospora sp. NPDC048540 TaxID=3155634 RepID=UPI0033F1827E